MANHPDDIAPLVAGVEEEPPIIMRMAVVESWDPETGDNVIVMGGTRIADLPILNSTEGFSISAGDIVSVLGWKSDWWISGRIALPNDAARQDIRLVIYSNDGMEVRGGGGITVFDGGSVRALYADGTNALYFGSLVDSGGNPTGHGLLVRSNDDNILNASRNTDGTIEFQVGQTTLRPPVFMYATTYLVDASAQMDFITGSSFDLTSGGQQVFNSGTGSYFFLNSTTTTNAANCYIGTGGSGGLQEVTSSAQHKLDVADLTTDPDTVLQMRPRTWRDRGEVEDNPDTTHRIPGFVAEEVAALGLEEFVTRDAEGQPLSVLYDRIPAALVALAQRQQQQIDDLTARVAALEGNP